MTDSGVRFETEPVELVVFDCDGVLVDSETISNDVLARMISEQGHVTTLIQARAEYQGMLLRDVVGKVEGKLGGPLPEGWLADYERQRTEAFEAGLEAVPGAQELVEAPRTLSAVGPFDEDAFADHVASLAGR